MKKNQYSNEHENMDSKDKMNFDMEEQYKADKKHEGRFFEFLYNLKEENPWDERDFDLVFMYL